MGAPFGYQAYLWLRKHPWVLAAGAALVFLKLRDNRLEAKHRQDERRKHEDAQRRADEEAEEFTETLEKEAEIDADDALEARDSAEPLPSDELSDEDFNYLFGHDRPPASGGSGDN